MSAMETSLRRALEAGDARDPAFRDSIYTASERALERLLSEKPMDDHTAHARRVLLAETINRIEAEYFAHFGDGGNHNDIDAELAQDDRTAPALSHLVNQEDEERFIAESEAAQSRDEEPVPAFWADGEETFADADATETTPALGKSEAAPEGRWSPKAAGRWRALPGKTRPLGKGGAIGVILLLAVLAGIYFVYGAVLAPLENRSESAQGATNAEAEANWINLFDGKQLDVIATPNGGTVDSVTVRGEPAVRLAPANAGGEVNVAIGPGVVGEIEGRTVRVEIDAGSSDGKEREFGVRCLFGEQTVCARQRFHTSQARESFVFDMAVPQKPANAGVLAIDSTLGGDAHDLDLYSVRLRSLDKS